MGSVGYVVGYALARDYLKQGLTVVVDCVNPLRMTRDAWCRVAADCHTPALEVEVICSDVEEHRRRAESRPQDITGLVWPTWHEITALEYEPWSRDRLLIDNATMSASEAAERLTRAMRLGNDAPGNCP